MIKLIAEVGWNHMGDMNLAKDMIVEAVNSGADIVKFQTWSEKNLKQGPWDDDGRREIYKEAELSFDDHIFLKNECEKNGVEFLTSIFCIKDLSIIEKLNLKTIKIPSHEIYNRLLIKELNNKFEKILLSAGACTWQEIEEAVRIIDEDKLVLMHCVSAYPCPEENVNFSKLKRLKKLSKEIGYSGHYQGVEDAIVAIAMGATFIEKHFTIDQQLPGRDNKNAILPKHLKKIAEFRDLFSKMMQDRGFEVQEIEKDIYQNYRGRWG